jgi:hypothetical protein
MSTVVVHLVCLRPMLLKQLSGESYRFYHNTFSHYARIFLPFLLLSVEYYYITIWLQKVQHR